MRAIAIEEFGGSEKLKRMDLPEPKAGPGEVLVRVLAAGINPVDWKIREGWLKEHLPHAFPLVPGWDVAGTVEEIGEGMSRFRKGERVFAYARKPVVQWGTYAELVAVPETSVARMPSRLLFEEAAAIPLAALTAYQSLFGTPAIGPGAVVLIHGGGGGVGHFAVQLARNAGARVLATSGTAGQEFVLGLGAQHVIDYTHEDWSDAVDRLSPDGVDFVYDTVGGETQRLSFDVLKPGGRLVSIVTPPDPALAQKRGVKADYVFVEPSASQLSTLGEMCDAGKLKPSVERIFPLADAAEAHELSQAGHVHGKLVLAL
jgi:NADPH:quinone reductase-like Zn-dependent oxidoreductase